MPRLFLIELFAGTRSVSKAVRRSSIGRAFDDFRLLSVDVDPKFQPTVCADINRWDCKSALDTFLADRTRSDVVVVHASPPCTEFSIALTTRPRNLRAGSKNVKTALRIIDYAAPSFWIIENPATGHLKDQPFMRKLERYKNTTCYCKWGSGTGSPRTFGQTSRTCSCQCVAARRRVRRDARMVDISAPLNRGIRRMDFRLARAAPS